MIEIIAGILANFVTERVKTKKDEDEYFSPEEKDMRKLAVRSLNGFLGAVSLFATSYLLAEPLDVTSFEDLLTTGFSLAGTFLVSQGMYYLTKNK